MKIYRVIDKVEYITFKKYDKFLQRDAYISQDFTTFAFNPVQRNSLFFFINILDAKEFALDNLTDYYICEIDINSNLITLSLGVGLYLRCPHHFKFEVLVPIDEINKHLSTFKIVARVKKGVFKSKIKPKLTYSTRLCVLFLSRYNIELKRNMYAKFFGNSFRPNQIFNDLMLKKVI